MSFLRTVASLAFGVALLAGCNAHKDQPAADSAVPAEPASTQAPDATGAPPQPDTTMPADQPDPAMSDSLPTDPNPPPQKVPPPNG